MNILTVENITKSYGVRKLFDHTGFYLQEGEKAGIIGINGTGKSTLLKIIAGLEEPDEGNVIRANHVVIRYLPQNPEFAPQETVLEAVLRGNRTIDNEGYIEADAEMKNNLDGVFVAGDIRNTPYRQIVCATGDGAIASVSAYKYVSKQKGTLYE